MAPSRQPKPQPTKGAHEFSELDPAGRGVTWKTQRHPQKGAISSTLALQSIPCTSSADHEIFSDTTATFALDIRWTWVVWQDLSHGRCVWVVIWWYMCDCTTPFNHGTHIGPLNLPIMVHVARRLLYGLRAVLRQKQAHRATHSL